MNEKAKRVLLLSGLVWFVSNFHHPVTPSHFTGLSLPDHVFGTSYAAMVCAMFFTAPIWGSIGDRGYRKQTLVFVTFIYGIFQILLGRATTLFGIILYRALAGLFCSGFHVGLMSALVDESKGVDREKLMAKYSAVMGITGALGFLAGGVLGYLPTTYVFYIQGILMMAIAVWTYFFVEDINPEAKKYGKNEKPKFVWDLVKDARSSKEVFTPWVIIFLFITFFVGIGYSGYINAFNYFLRKELGYPPVVNGIWRAVNGIFGLVGNLTINVWLINKTDTKKSICFLLLLNFITGMVVYLNSNTYIFFIFNFIFFAVHLLEIPILQGFAVADNIKEVGLMSGIFNAVKSLGEMTGSIISGYGYNISSKFPFFIGASSMGLAFIFALYYQIRKDHLNSLKRGYNEI